MDTVVPHPLEGTMIITLPVFQELLAVLRRTLLIISQIPLALMRCIVSIV